MEGQTRLHLSGVPFTRISSGCSLNLPSLSPHPSPVATHRALSLNMAEEPHGAWFGFGFCGFGQALGSGNGRRSVHSPEPLSTREDICRVSASWSYTALVTRKCPHNADPGPVPCTPTQPFQTCLSRNTPTPSAWQPRCPPGPWHVSQHSLPTQVEAGWSCQAL